MDTAAVWGWPEGRGGGGWEEVGQGGEMWTSVTVSAIKSLKITIFFYFEKHSEFLLC